MKTLADTKAETPRYACVLNPDCAGYHESKHELCDQPELFLRLGHMEHDFATQPHQKLYAETIGEAANRLKRVEGQEFKARGAIASFCDGASKMIDAIDQLPKDADAERCQKMLREMALKLRGAVLRATD